MKFYIISPSTKKKTFNPENLEKISEIIPVEFFQLRPKHREINKRLEFVENNFDEFRKVCTKKKIKMIINDDFKIAEKFKFDGIHLGQEDKRCSEAKKKFGKNFIVGVSCSDSFYLYNKAFQQNADYVAFGPVYQTTSKKRKRINIKKLFPILENLRLPFTLIGGINHMNLKECLNFNPDHVAMISSFWDFKKGPVESAFLFQKILKESDAYEN